MAADPIVVEYDPLWPCEFAALAAVLAPALGALASGMHHVGSTSIPGMAAKPILDIDVALAPGVPVDAATAALGALGYEYEGEQGIAGRHAYRNVSPAVPYCAARRLAAPSPVCLPARLHRAGAASAVPGRVEGQ